MEVIARRRGRQKNEGAASEALLFTIHLRSVRPSKCAAIGASCGLMSDSCGVDLSDGGCLSGLGQRRTKVTGCYADLTPKDGGQVALIGKADFLCDQSQRLISSADQSFCPFDPPVHHITLRPHTNRLLEAAAEVVGAETCHPARDRPGSIDHRDSPRCSHTRASAAHATIRSTARSEIAVGSPQSRIICTASAVLSASARIWSRKLPSISLAMVDTSCEISGSLRLYLGARWTTPPRHHLRSSCS